MRHKLEEMVGKHYGQLRVLAITEGNRCLCECDCGNRKIILPSNIKAGRTRSCGCLEKKNQLRRKKNLIGQRFSRLVVIEETEKRSNGNVVWRCRCDCGNYCGVTTRNLIRGDTKSCGCLKAERSDITGERFGKLVALEPIRRRKQQATLWVCRCDCGKLIVVQITNLRNGHTKSCGCLKDRHQLGLIEGTNLSLIRSKKLNRNNTSGVKGVSYSNSRQRWIAKLNFQGKAICKSCKTFEEAVRKRKEMEQVFERFVKEYEERLQNR